MYKIRSRFREVNLDFGLGRGYLYSMAKCDQCKTELDSQIDCGDAFANRLRNGNLNLTSCLGKNINMVFGPHNARKLAHWILDNIQ